LGDETGDPSLGEPGGAGDSSLGSAGLSEESGAGFDSCFIGL